MTSTSQLSEGEIKFTRFFLLNFKVSPDIARRYFDGVFPPTHLAHIINNSMHDIMKLNKSRIINKAQLEILRSVPGTVWPSYLPPMHVGTKSTSSKDFDLTMLICLLRNLGGLATPTNGWDKLPEPNEISPGADLATLKWHRNDLAHATVTCMDSNEFTDKWNQVEKALTSLNRGQKPLEVIDILKYDLDGEQANILANAELKQMKEELYLDCEKEKEQIESDFSFYRDGNLPKNIADTNTDLVEAWIKDDESFFETQGSKLVGDKINDFNCLVVTSNSGLGKTATIRHIALKLKYKGFEIVPVESPEDIIKYKTNKKQLFLIDDVLGKYDLSPTRLDEWENKNEKLISCLDTGLGSKKIMCTLRLQITLNKRFKNASTILNKAVINLEHESCALSKEEKKNILMSHLRRSNLDNNITTEEVAKMCKSDYAFPLLCKLVSSNEERFRKKLAFFRQPISLLKEELSKISNENKSLYCMLVLCMLFNGSFRRRMFEIDSNEGDKKIYKIMHTCGLQRSISKKELENSALSALGSYFTTDSFNFKFIHDALEETVGIHFCTLYPSEMFADCDIAFIGDRVRIHSNECINVNADENNLFINVNADEYNLFIREDKLKEDCFRPLYTRLSNELKRGRFSTLMVSHLFRNRNFVSEFGTYLKNNKIKLGLREPFLKTSYEGSQIIEQSFIRKTLNVLSFKQLQNNADAISRVMQAGLGGSTIMHWIVAFGCYEFFRYAWSTMTPSQHKRFFNITWATLIEPVTMPIFPLAVHGGSLDIVKELINTGADVNCFSKSWETPLYIAVKSGRYDMAHLLLRNGALVNIRGWFDMKLPILVTSNNQQLTSLILEYDLSQTEFHKAVRHNDLQQLSLNIPLEYIDSRTRSGWTILHYAVLLNKVEAVKVLFNEELPQNDDYSVEVIQDDQRAPLCRKPTPRVNVVDNNGLTAVHIAVINNYIEILSILLRNNAKVEVRDDFDRTPLHYTTSEMATKLLLNQSSKTQCLATNRNVNEMTEYEKAPLSVLRTTCFNLTLKTAFRHVCREYVNMPDSAGNTPLHSVLNRCHLKEERSDCIETLLENGANPYLLNDRSISAFELIDSCCDTAKYINNSVKYKRSLQKTHKIFAFVSFAFSIGLLICFFCISSNISIERSKCKEMNLAHSYWAHSYNIALVQVIRIPYGIFLVIVPFWSFMLLTFKMRGSIYRLCFVLYLLMGCGSFILIGAFMYHTYTTVHTITAVSVTLLFFFILYGTSLEILLMYTVFMFLKDRKRKNIGFIFIFLCSLYFFSQYFVFLFGTLAVDNELYVESDINSLSMYSTALNCFEYRFNISCSSLNSAITYRNGVDFSVRCVDPKMNKYYSMHSDGTLIVESEYIDLLIIAMFSMLLHFIFANCFINCILPYTDNVIKAIGKLFRLNYKTGKKMREEDFSIHVCAILIFKMCGLFLVLIVLIG
ncbi:uncharacterized protein [Mytilus edulis]|uniref:uncharacterized protein n=1 Tax=Mytilus edulis TaxID=6550 RepID=UPI0039F0E458